MIRLRKVWKPAPGWPRPPRGFRPATGWEPDPAWPPAPDGWRFWRIAWPRLTAAVALIALAPVLWTWFADDVRTLHAHRALDSRGLTTTATVLTSSYDPDGGDPNGWTTDQMRFTTAAGTVVTATLGHHGRGGETAGNRQRVTYDPRDPSVARLSAYVDDDDDPTYALVGAALAVGVTAAAFCVASRALTVRAGGSAR